MEWNWSLLLSSPGADELRGWVYENFVRPSLKHDAETLLSLHDWIQNKIFLLGEEIDRVINAGSPDQNTLFALRLVAEEIMNRVDKHKENLGLNIYDYYGFTDRRAQSFQLNLIVPIFYHFDCP
jgi:hypothetical protein